MEKKTPGEKFSNHPCHRLSVPSAKRFWCRHCFEMFDDPISRWRHSKTCKNTTLSNSIRRREQEAMALEAYCESTRQSPSAEKPVTLPNLNPKTTIKSYVGPKEDNIVDLSCFICQRQFSSIEEMKEHVRVPCNKASSDGDSPFSSVVYHRRGIVVKEEGQEEEEMEYGESGQEARQSPTPLDTSHLSSETMAAVEALNMMARSDNVNLSQFLNQLSEGGFVIEQAAGTSSAGGSQDREIIFTVQGDGSEPGSLLQHGGDITVEVAEDLIRMAQRVRVEAVEHVVEEEVVQEEVVQDLEPNSAVRYIDDQSELEEGGGEFATSGETHAQFVEQTQEQVQEEVKEEVEEEEVPEAVNEEGQLQEGECETDSTFTIVNLVSGKKYSGNVVVPMDGGTTETDSDTSENVEIGKEPLGEKPIVKDVASIPVEKRKLEKDVAEDEGQVRVKVEGASQVKKLCTEIVTDQHVSESSVKDEVFEAKKKLQFFSEGLIVQEKCNKNSECSQKSTLETISVQTCKNIEILSSVSPVLPEGSKSHPTNTDTDLNFLDEVDGEFKPMTDDMVKVQETILDIGPLEKVDCASVDEIFTVIKKEPRHKLFLASPKALRSSSRKLILTPKKLRLLEEKDRRNKKKNKCKNTVSNQKSNLSILNRKSVVTPPGRKSGMNPKSLKSDFNKKEITKDIKAEPVEKEEKVTTAPIEKPKKTQQRSLKCRACDKVFNTKRQLIKHKSVPCIVKVTRNTCQNILRPKRALPRLPEKKIVRKKSVSKESRKPKLLPVGLHIHAQWTACRQVRKLTRGRGRPRKQTVHFERRKHIVLPDRTLEVSSLSKKEQFFFELALVCSDYVLVKPKAQASNLLTIGVDDDCDKLSANDMSPPILEKIDPHAVNKFVSEHPPDLTCSENLEPPTLEHIGIHDAAKIDVKIDAKCDSNDVCASLQLARLDSDSKQDRHFLDSFTPESDISISPCKSQVSMDVDEKLRDKTSQRPAVELSPKKNDLMAHLKSTLKNVRSPSNSRKTRPDVTSNTSPNSKRNLFEVLQTLCSDSAKISGPSSSTTPTLSSSVLCSKLKANINRNLSPRKHVFSPSPRKSSSAHSTPRKMPNILLRRSTSETKERSACILGVVAQSMGINVLNLSPTSSNSKDSKSERCLVSPLRESQKESALTCLGKLASPVQVVRKNLFEKKHEPALPVDGSSRANHDQDHRTCGPVLSKTVPVESESRLSPIEPMIAMSNLQSGQILVSPIPAGSSRCPVKYASEMSRSDSVPTTQCPLPPASAPIKTVLGQLEQKLKLLKSALQNRSGSSHGSPSKLTDKELISILLEESNEHHSRLRQISMDKCNENESSVNLPDVVRSVTESRHLSGNLPEIAVNSMDTTVVDTVEPMVNICKGTASDTYKSKSALLRDSPEKSPPRNSGLAESLASENHSDFGKSSSKFIDDDSDGVEFQDSQLNSTRLDSDSNASSSLSIIEDSNRVKVQYINQLDSTGPNGLTYLLIQQEGSDDYLTSCLGADFTMEAGETIHAVTIEEDEEVITGSLLGNIYTPSLSRTEREVFVHSSGF